MSLRLPDDFAIACLGDSITDGFATAVDKDQAWPTLLAKRFGEKKTGRGLQSSTRASPAIRFFVTVPE